MPLFQLVSMSPFRLHRRIGPRPAFLGGEATVKVVGAAPFCRARAEVLPDQPCAAINSFSPTNCSEVPYFLAYVIFDSGAYITFEEYTQMFSSLMILGLFGGTIGAIGLWIGDRFPLPRIR